VSRVGKHAVKVPGSVSLTQEGSKITAVGKMGTLSYVVPDCLRIQRVDDGILLCPVNKEKMTRSLWGTAQRRLANMVSGVTDGFSINLELIGVGYRAVADAKKLTLQLGFSHDVVLDIPAGISIKCEKPTSLTVTSADKQSLGQFVSELRSYRPPEPYKGKGIIREGEYVLRKEGKKK
jgi:large subunit ribosomal protein L6